MTFLFAEMSKEQQIHDCQREIPYCGESLTLRGFLENVGQMIFLEHPKIEVDMNMTEQTSMWN